MGEDKKTLQNTRKESIKTLIERYKKLTDDIFDQVGKELPQFDDHKDEEDQVITSAEKKLYAFLNVRKDALKTANEMLLTINDLESELSDPDYHKNKEIRTGEASSTEVVQHPSKRHARN